MVLVYDCLSCSAIGMPQKEDYENRIFRLEESEKRRILAMGGVANLIRFTRASSRSRSFFGSANRLEGKA